MKALLSKVPVQGWALIIGLICAAVAFLFAPYFLEIKADS